MKKIIIVSVCSFFLLSITVTSCKKDDVVADDSLRVFALTEQLDGKSYSDLGEVAAKWYFPADFAKSPLDDADGSRSAVGVQPLSNVVILASNLSGISTRKLTIPAGRPVYFPIVGFTNWYFVNDKCYPDYKPVAGQSLADFLAADTEPIMNGVKNLTAQLDGKDLVADLTKFKVKTKPFAFVPPKDLLDPACDYTNQTSTALDISYALLVRIPKGKHVLTYKADLPDANNFHTEVTWNLTVE